MPITKLYLNGKSNILTDYFLCHYGAKMIFLHESFVVKTSASGTVTALQS